MRKWWNDEMTKCFFFHKRKCGCHLAKKKKIIQQSWGKSSFQRRYIWRFWETLKADVSCCLTGASIKAKSRWQIQHLINIHIWFLSHHSSQQPTLNILENNYRRKADLYLLKMIIVNLSWPLKFQILQTKQKLFLVND